MLTRRSLLKTMGSAPLACSALGPLAAHAQDDTYPSRTITLMVPFAAGNASDTSARLVAEGLSKRLQQQVIVENYPSAGGVRGINLAALAKPDGYTLLHIGAVAAITQALYKPPPYDVLRDFTPLSTLNGNDILFLVNADSKAKTIADLTADAKSRGAGVMGGLSTLGTTQYMTAELFKWRAKLGYTLVPFGSAAKNLNALAGGQIDFAVEFLPSAMPLIQGGKLRALAVCGPTRTSFLPDVPTLIESGYPDIAVQSWGMLLTRAKTPPAIVQRLNKEIQAVLKEPNVVATFKEMGARVLGGTSEQARDLMSSEIARWAEVGQAANIKL